MLDVLISGAQKATKKQSISETPKGKGKQEKIRKIQYAVFSGITKNDFKVISKFGQNPRNTTNQILTDQARLVLKNVCFFDVEIRKIYG